MEVGREREGGRGGERREEGGRERRGSAGYTAGVKEVQGVEGVEDKGQWMYDSGEERMKESRDEGMKD